MFLMFFAFFSAYYTCGAMVLFTISSPSFYFFGVPTVFAIIYLTCHCEYVGNAKAGTRRNANTCSVRVVGGPCGVFDLPPVCCDIGRAVVGGKSVDATAHAIHLERALRPELATSTAPSLTWACPLRDGRSRLPWTLRQTSRRKDPDDTRSAVFGVRTPPHPIILHNRASCRKTPRRSSRLRRVGVGRGLQPQGARSRRPKGRRGEVPPEGRRLPPGVRRARGAAGEQLELREKPGLPRHPPGRLRLRRRRSRGGGQVSRRAARLSM